MNQTYTYLKPAFLLFAFFWFVSGNAQGDFQLTVNHPDILNKDYTILQGSFGPGSCETPEITGDLMFVEDGTGGTEACDTVVNDLTGKIAIIDRGNCDFSFKVYQAQKKGAIGVIVCNNVTEDNFAMGPGSSADSITIPAWMMNLEDCMNLRTLLPDSVNVTIQRLTPEDNSVDDIVIWEEDFDGGFNGWTPISLECAGVSDPVNAIWEWRQEGDIGQGSFIPEGSIMFSNTPCNGVVIFDSDLLDSEGDALNPDTGEAIPGELGDGPCISPQEAELISPPIDLSSADPNSAIGIKFVQNVRNFDAEFYVGWSTDDGATWNETRVNSDLDANDTRLDIVRIILGGVTPPDELMVKFRFVGDYYYWAIDDVKIILFTGINAMIGEVFYTPLSFAFPQVFADADTFVFVSDVINRGANDLTTVRLEVDIINTDTEESVFKDSGSISNVGIGDTATVVTDNLFVPVDLDTGLYRMDYTISLPDQQESDESDNSESHFFYITEDLFSKEPGANVAFNPFTGEWAMGAIYRTSVQKYTGYVATEAIFQLGTNSGAAMTDNFVDVYLLKVNPGVNPLDFSTFDFNDTDINGHPSFEVVGQNTHVYTNEGNYDVVTLPLAGEAGVALDPGAFYILLLRFEDIQAGNANQSNSELFMAANDEIPGSGFIFYSIQNNQWFNGFVGFDPAWLLRMRIALSTSVDEVPLREEAFQIYPNPSSDYIWTKMEFDKATDGELVIADINGRVISIQPLHGMTSSEEKIDVSQLPGGTYFIRLSTSNGTRTHKIVVQH